MKEDTGVTEKGKGTKINLILNNHRKKPKNMHSPLPLVTVEISSSKFLVNSLIWIWVALESSPLSSRLVRANQD